MSTVPSLPGMPSSPDERHAILDRVDELLDDEHHSSTLGNFEDPLEETIYILLSKQTHEATYQRTYASLRAWWPNWNALRNATLEELEAVLLPSGLSKQRANQLRALLDAIAEECARRGVAQLSLNWLRDLDDAAAQAYLESLPGISTKSARCVLHYSLDRNVFAVDTHIRRILDRLGLVPDPGGKVKHSSYDEAIPAKYRQRLHINLIHHGRAYCKARSPRCDSCPLISFCASGRTRMANTKRDAESHTSRRPRKPTTKPVAIELFAGGGGLGEGFTRAGFDIAIAVELDRAAAQTYRLNHPGTVVLEADATKITAEDLVALAPRAADPAAIIAGPPCQGYSAAGKRQAADGKNSLYTAVVELAKALRPRFVAIENVPGLRSVEGKSFVETINTALTGAGYNSREHLLRACDFGVPQLRRRLLFLAQRADLGTAPEAPKPTHCPGKHCSKKCGDDPGSRCGLDPTKTVLDVLEDLPTLASGQIAEYLVLDDGFVLLNGSTMDHSPRVITKIKAITPGSGPISYRRLHPDMARTIVAGHRALPVHPSLHRTLSVREAARIQGFNDDHVFCGSRSQQPLQVANAVPPPLAEAVALELLNTSRIGPAGEATDAVLLEASRPAIACSEVL
jgi:DNA (cytosine-5)-methyltransferase 1